MRIAESGDYNLSGERYKEVAARANRGWEMVELGDICENLDSKRKPVTKSDRKKWYLSILWCFRNC